ncbi:MAG: CotH kinase family protein [Bacteroidetes bacterium]|nr:CotH kinase family protein [Bacteroidota bacterium]
MNCRHITGLLFIMIASVTLSVGCNRTPNIPGISCISIRYDSGEVNFEVRNPCLVTYIDPIGDTVFRELPAGIRYRGNMAGEFEKKSYSLKLSAQKSIERFATYKNWILNAAYVDKTFCRDKISYDLFRRFSPGNISPRISYTELFINGQYKGMYLVVERMDERRLGLDTSDYSAVVFKESPVFQKPAGHEENCAKLRDFLKTCSRYKNFSESGMNKLLQEAYYNQRFPDMKDTDRTEVINEISRFLFESSDEEFACPGKGVDSVFDLENIIDWHLLLLITDNGDGIVKNFYLYRRSSQDKFCLCPWDYDHSFGRDGDGEPNPDSFLDCNRSVLIHRLTGINAFDYNKRLSEKYYSLKQSGILTPESLTASVDSIVDMLGPFLIKNDQLWPVEEYVCPVTGKKHFEGSDSGKELKLMKDWIGKRFDKIEKYLAEIND